jgi:CRP/FNR family transcriptional regulator, cyclic AMP receptor protein
MQNKPDTPEPQASQAQSTPESFTDSQGVKEAQVLGAKNLVPELSILRTDPEAASKAAMLLMQPSALGEITLLDARRVVAYLKAHRIPAGTTFIRQDDKAHTDFMLLVLEGEATIENQVVSRTEPMVDGLPRSANAVATTDMLLATLSRASLTKLLVEHPDVASKVMLAISRRLSALVRESNNKLRSYARLVEIMQDELQEQIVRSGALARIALSQSGVVKPGSGGKDL